VEGEKGTENSRSRVRLDERGSPSSYKVSIHGQLPPEIVNGKRGGGVKEEEVRKKNVENAGRKRLKQRRGDRESLGKFFQHV